MPRCVPRLIELRNVIEEIGVHLDIFIMIDQLFANIGYEDYAKKVSCILL